MAAQGYPYAAPGAFAGFGAMPFGAMPFGYGAMPYGYGPAPYNFFSPFGISKAPGAAGYTMPFGVWGKDPYGV